MNKQETDIELIRKYFNGELSTKAQHELEKRALDDSFLKDVMDGFESSEIKEIDFLDLNNRLAKRLKKHTKIIPINWSLKRWGIAASVIFGIAILSIYFNQTPENKTIALSELQNKVDYPKSAKIIPDILEEVEKNSLVSLENMNPQITENDMRSSFKIQEYSPADDITIEQLSQNQTLMVLDTVSLTETNVASTPKRDLSSYNPLVRTENGASLQSKTAVLNNNILAGKVTDISNGSALPGVQITNSENGQVAITNAKGEFKITVNDKTILKINYIGFMPESVSVTEKDSLNISLRPTPAILEEEAVITYRSGKKHAEIFAGPYGGWAAFRKYLDENAILSSEGKSRVVLEFIIQKNGQLTNFKILKSVSYSIDNKALKLIKDYGSWNGSADGKPQKAKVVVRFK